MTQATTERDTVLVARVQEHLRAFGYEEPPDGVARPAMHVALARFQESVGLPRTGDLDDDTWQHLMARLNPAAPQAPRAPERPSLHALRDQAVVLDADDRLGFAAYADAIAGIIDNPETGTPLTIAISAPWGAGKSTLAAMVRHRLETKPAAGGSRPHVTCLFNAWMHDDARNLGSAFAAELARTAHLHRPFLHRVLRPIPWALATARQRIRQLAVVAVVVIVLSFFAAWLGGIGRILGGLATLQLISGDQLKAITDHASGKAVGTVVLTLLALLGRAAMTMGKSLSDFVKDPETAATRGTLNGVQQQLGKLIREATPPGSRFVIFVDDLERCRPPRSVDLLEIVNLMLGHEGVVTVIMADMPAVAACAEIKYKILADRYNPADRKNVPAGVRSTYGRLYLQKIVQLQFDIPAHIPGRIRDLVEALVAKQEPSPLPVPAPAWQRLWQRTALAGSDVWAGARHVLVPQESRKIWAFGAAAALLLLMVDGGGAAALFTTTGSAWTAKAAAIGLAAGAWIALALTRSRSSREVALPPALSTTAMLGVSAAVFATDRLAVEPVRQLVVDGEPGWLTIAMAPPGTSWFWGIFAMSLLAGGLLFVKTSLPAERLQVPAGSVGAAIRRAARGSWWCLAVIQLWLVADQLLLAEGGPIDGLSYRFDFGYPSHAALVHDWRVASAVLLVGGLAWAGAHLWSCGRDQRLAEARQDIDTRLANGEVVATDDVQLRALVNERKLLRLINDSELLREAYDEVLTHLHQLPRNAKRAINRVRLLLFVAHAREAFGGSPPLTPRHVGRWIAFQERWPEVAALMTGDPALMLGLECAASAPERQALLGLLPEPVARSFAHDEDLAAFLGARTVPLGPVMERLVYLPPASNGTAATAP